MPNFEFPPYLLATSFSVQCVQYPALGNITIAAKIITLVDKDQVKLTVIDNRANFDMIKKMIGTEVNMKVTRFEQDGSGEEFSQIERTMKCVSSESTMDCGANTIGTSVITFEAPR